MPLAPRPARWSERKLTVDTNTFAPQLPGSCSAPCWAHSLVLQPYRTHPMMVPFGMTTQITVRLPDELVAFVDDLVSQGDAASRAAVVSRALERERRRKVAQRDAVILASADRDIDLNSLAESTATSPMDHLD
jgi:Arc/MetJ-type ribon-helix-helix transcriptional regulator